MWMRMIRSHGLTAQKLTVVVDGYRREDLPRIDAAPGFLGIALGENVDSGSIGSVTFWESEQAMLDTDRLSAEARERAVPMYSTPNPMAVEAFEVAYTNLLAPLAGSARSWMRLVRFLDLSQDAIDPAIASYRDDAERHIRETRGVEGIAIGFNRDAGSVAVVSGWTSQEAMRNAEQLSAQTRSRAASAASANAPLVDRYEITVASRLDQLAAVTA